MRRLADDQGAVTVLLAVMLIILLGAGALAIDFGRLYQERRELQNGADAGALAVVQECISAGVPCGSLAAQDIAEQYANANANDETSDATTAFNPSQCRIEVETTTRTDDGSVLLPPVLAQLLVEGYEGRTVSARAVAECGGIGEGEGLPLIIESKGWQNAVKIGPPPGNTDPEWWRDWTPTAGDMGSAFFHRTNTTSDYGAGAFGWTNLDSGQACQSTVTDIGTLPTNAGNDFGCSFHNPTGQNAAAFQDYILANNPHVVPLYSSFSGTGTNINYQVVGFGVIYITGWHFGSQYNYPKSPSGTPPCSGNERCLTGYFLTEVSLGEYKPGGGNFGVMTYSLIE